MDVDPGINPRLLMAGGGAVVVCVTTLIYALMGSKRSESEAIDRRLDLHGPSQAGAGELQSITKKPSPHLMDTLKSLAPKIAAPTSDEEQSRLKHKLESAGIRSESAPLIFLASKTLMGIIVAILTLMLTWQLGHPPLNIFGLTAVLGMTAFMLPNVWLSLTTGERMKQIRRGMADSLDLMVIMVESGLGMDAAIQRVGLEMDESYPELSEEFRIANAEINMGLTRVEALENLARRTGLHEMQILVSTIVQAERFGSSVGKTLRAQSDMLRTKRQQAAEEAAQKTAVKLLIPLILFIFPALMIVIGGPAMIGILKSFRDMRE